MVYLKFADALSSFEEAKIVILGVPFDRTSSFRGGAKFAPNKIREESYNLEDFVVEHSVCISELKVHDMGNIEEVGLPEDMVKEVELHVQNIFKSGKFPILIGGEHTIAYPGVKTAVKFFKNVILLSIDAHLDFRENYLNEKISHACVIYRIYELLGEKNIVSIGVRSASKEDAENATKLNLRYYTTYELKENGLKSAIKSILAMCENKKVYLTIDMDAIDPSYSPAVACPEYFGLSPYEMKEIINAFGNRLIGCDFSEVAPSYDSGNTASLCARLIREVICAVGKRAQQNSF